MGPRVTESILLCLVEIPRTKQKRLISKAECLVIGSGESRPRPRLPFDFIGEEAKGHGRDSDSHQ